MDFFLFLFVSYRPDITALVDLGVKHQVTYLLTVVVFVVVFSFESGGVGIVGWL